jgi:hypothetical protein
VGTIDLAGPAETFGAFLDRWLPKATILKELSPTTVREHKRTVEKNIKPALGEVELRKLDAGMLNDLYVSPGAALVGFIGAARPRGDRCCPGPGGEGGQARE